MKFCLHRTLTESVVDLIYHQRRVGLVLWHPTARNILLSAGNFYLNSFFKFII